MKGDAIASWLSRQQRWFRTAPLSDRLAVRRLIRSAEVTTELVAPRVRHLGGQRVWLRAGTSDAAVFEDTFVRMYHLPPPEAGTPRTILDLGSNIGLTMAHYACLYPSATILGVELDPATAAFGRTNIAPWANRCDLLNGAVWPTGEDVFFVRVQGEEWGAHVGEPGPDAVKVRGITINALLEHFDRPVDFLKMDIEGAEGEVLSHNTEWAEAVRTIKVEVHEPCTVEECTSKLEALGYRVRRDRPHVAALVAVRV